MKSLRIKIITLCAFLLLLIPSTVIQGRRKKIVPRAPQALSDPVAFDEQLPSKRFFQDSPFARLAQNESPVEPVAQPEAETQSEPEVAPEESPVAPPQTPAEPDPAPTPEVTPPQPEPTPEISQDAIEQENEVLQKDEAEEPLAEAAPEPPQDKDKEPSPEKDDSEQQENDIYLNFENTDLVNFVNYIAELKNLNLVTDPKIAGNKISLTIREAISKEGAWKVFLTVLEMSGFSIIKVGEIYKIIPKAGKGTEPLPTYINVPADTLPDSDLTIRFVTFLTNIPTDKVRQLLQSMLPQPNAIIEHQASNGFVITDKSYNIKAAMKVVQELDRSDVQQSVTVMKLKQSNAQDVKQLFDSLMKKPEGNPLARLLGKQTESSLEYFPPTTKIVTEPRTNSLILMGDQRAIKKIENFITKHIDTELCAVESPIHVYELKYTDVDQIMNILQTITEPPSDSAVAKHGGIRGGVKFFKRMKFSMDKENNRLIVSSTDKQDWKLLKKIIKDLDKPQPQVAIETLIVTVDFGKNKELGGQIRNRKHGMIGKNLDFQAGNYGGVVFEKDGSANLSLLGNLIGGLTEKVGSSILTFGKCRDIWGLFRMLQTEQNTSLLSQPFIVTTNMKKAKISVGETRRLVKERAIADTGAVSTDAAGYENVKAELNLEITPQINLEGVIKLNIDLNIEDFQEGEGNQQDRTSKKLNTNVSVANGQVLVLGGFVKTKITEDTGRTPVLGSIPVLGWLFKHKKRTVTKEYVFIFMSPTIIKPRQTPGSNLYTKMKIHQAKNDIDDTITVHKINDPVHNWFFNPDGETYSHKVVDFANARYQPTSVDIKNDPYYRAKTLRSEKKQKVIEAELPPEREKSVVEKVVPPPKEDEPPPEEPPAQQPESESVLLEEEPPDIPFEELLPDEPFLADEQEKDEPEEEAIEILETEKSEQTTEEPDSQKESIILEPENELSEIEDEIEDVVKDQLSDVGDEETFQDPLALRRQKLRDLFTRKPFDSKEDALTTDDISLKRRTGIGKLFSSAHEENND